MNVPERIAGFVMLVIVSTFMAHTFLVEGGASSSEAFWNAFAAGVLALLAGWSFSTARSKKLSPLLNGIAIGAGVLAVCGVMTIALLGPL